MAVTNPTTPASYNFSKNFIPLRFLSDNYLEQAGVKSINVLGFFNAVANGTVITISFGANVVTFTAVSTAPDTSGLQIPAGAGDVAYAASLVAYFQANHIIDQYFDIHASGNAVLFTAKKAGTGFDFTAVTNAVFELENITPGVTQIVRDAYYIHFELFCQNADHTDFVSIHTAQISLRSDQPGISEVDIADRLNAYLETDVLDIPDTGSTAALLCKKSCRKFYYTYAESWGQPAVVRKKIKSAEYTILAGGLSFKGNHVKTLPGLLVPDVADATKDRFLKQGSSHQYTRKDQPQFLYFFNTRATQDGRLRVKFTFTDGTASADVTVTAVALTTLGKVAFNVTHDRLFTPADYPGKLVKHYEVWLETVAGVKISETRTYYLNYKAQQFVRYMVSWSSWGAFDTRLCYGKATSSLELVQQEAKRILKSGDDIKKGNSTVFDVKLNNKFKVSTGHIDRSELILNRDFYLSPHKFRYTSGLFLPIKVTSKDIPEIPDGETLFHQEFEYEYRFTDDVFTEGDVDEPGLGIEGFFFNSVIPSLPSNGIIETDPTVPSWVKAITQADINKWNLFNQDGYNKANWDIAYSWGNHNTMGYALSANYYDKTTSDGRFIQNRYDYQTDARLNVRGGKFLNYLVIPNGAPSVLDMEEGECAIYFDTSGLGGGAPQPPVIANFPDLGDVDISGRLDGYEVYWNATASKYMHRAPAGSGVSSWNDLTDKPTTLSGYGIQTEGDGRWLGINATAANSTKWNGYQYVGLVTPNSYMMAFDGTNWGASTAAQIQSFLGLGSAAYLNASQSATANTAAQRDADGTLSASTLNQNQSLRASETFDAIYAGFSTDGFIRKYDINSVKLSLGLGSAAYLNASTTNTASTVVQRDAFGQIEGQNINAAGYLNSVDDVDAGGIGYIMGKVGASNTIRSFSANYLKTFLGLGSNAFSSTAYLPLTAGSGSPLSGTLHSGITGLIFSAQGATAERRIMYLANTGGDIAFGVEGSAGGSTFTGSSPYSSILGTGVATPLEFFTNNAKRYTIDASGNNTWTGSGTFGSLGRAIIRQSAGGDAEIGGGAGAYLSLLANNTEYARLRTDGFNLYTGLTGTSATFGSAAVKNWSGSSDYARFGHKDIEASYYGFLQHYSGDVYLKGLSIYLDSPVSVTSLLTAPKIKANTLLTIPTIAPNVNDMANGEVAIWAEGFN
ncbi:hypothetical protein ACFSJU_14745 [Paradesertivirga mongoliensis]|uniref:Uncharacterized protein n=1 Tax=Paradesertivirga mongoliensis TaxID=2100740 RepID=A0ABW4ZNL6_9SPHI|nr:hypothetical protein [Pedobacter mongoliensis]